MNARGDGLTQHHDAGDDQHGCGCVKPIDHAIAFLSAADIFSRRSLTPESENTNALRGSSLMKQASPSENRSRVDTTLRVRWAPNRASTAWSLPRKSVAHTVAGP